MGLGQYIVVHNHRSMTKISISNTIRLEFPNSLSMFNIKTIPTMNRRLLALSNPSKFFKLNTS